MLFRERLKQEHPEKVDEGYWGGCKDCPEDYGYEKHKEGLCHKGMHDCERCWSRKER